MLTNFDTSRLYRYQVPMMPEKDTSQQFVVGKVIKNELWLLFGSHPPQIAPISNIDIKFRVFVLGEKADMDALASIWRHTSRFHETTLQLFSLQDLGIDEISV